jgi:hypothetical protein
MLSRIRGEILRPCRLAAATAAVALATAALPSTSFAQEAVEDESVYSFSAGVDFTSHFISYGNDVWDGEDDANPFGNDSTAFGYATMNVAMADNVTLWFNIWSDINNNAEDSIGGKIQEIDLTAGLTFTMDAFAFTVSHGCWLYAGDEEKIIDFVIAYTDSWFDGFTINPSITAHWRYDEHAGQAQDGWAIVPAIKPSFTLNGESEYPITIGFPMAIGFMTDEFQDPSGGVVDEGDSGIGYYSVGGAVSVPLSFIPPKYGSWSVSGSLIYYMTDEDVIVEESNPDDSFLVTAVSLGASM